MQCVVCDVCVQCVVNHVLPQLRNPRNVVTGLMALAPASANNKRKPLGYHIEHQNIKELRLHTCMGTVIIGIPGIVSID